MIVATSIEELAGTLDGACVTIGNFDGVHLGHRKLLARTRDKARAHGRVSVAVTFDPHPMRVLAGPDTPPFITLTPQKLELIAAVGLDITLVLEFTRAMATLEPDAFVRAYLLEGLRMRDLVIGYDYAFGKGRRGDYDMLAAMGRREGFSVERIGPVMIGDAVVSSTRIRDLVQAGKVFDARELLGRFYVVRGRVEKGRDRGGRLLGCPTANVRLDDELCPAMGVYAVWAEVDGRVRPAVANIGYNPTFGNDVQSVEVHILDFDSDIYDREMRVHFVQRLRSEKKFDGLDALKAQIDKDISLGRTILEQAGAQL